MEIFPSGEAVMVAAIGDSAAGKAVPSAKPSALTNCHTPSAAWSSVSGSAGAAGAGVADGCQSPSPFRSKTTSAPSPAGVSTRRVRSFSKTYRAARIASRVMTPRHAARPVCASMRHSQPPAKMSAGSRGFTAAAPAGGAKNSRTSRPSGLSVLQTLTRPGTLSPSATQSWPAASSARARMDCIRSGCHGPSAGRPPAFPAT